VLKERTLAWVLRPGELRAVAIAQKRDALAAQVSGLLSEMRESAPQARQRMATLYAALVAPLGLKPGEAMLAVAHDALYMLPFGALHDGKSWLIEQRAVAMLPSLNAMRALLQSAPAAMAGALVMGNPDLRDAKFDLPAAEREAAAIAGQLPGAALYTREAATRARLMADAPGRRIVHVAAHALVDELDPLASPLYLAGDGTSAAMTARDFYGVDLRATRLITLSACETGLGKVGRGNEFWGFQRTMLAAGARGLLVSLWPVEDEATAALMTKFYAAAATRPLLAALRDAQLDLVRRYRDQPVLWAGFVLVGDWR
jgi:CHAT domain-containing protein